MELKIFSPSEDGFVKAILWNNEDLKKELAERLEEYKGLVYDETQVTAAKADRAKLNKLVDALEAKRKEIKKQCLAPYEAFEKQVKELIELINEPIALIDSQIKNFEEEKRSKKADEIRACWDGMAAEFPPYEMIFNPKWLNASTSLKSIKKEMEGILVDTVEAMKTLDALPEYSFEARDVYKRTLDLNKAIAEANRLADVAKRKAEEEARRAEEAAKRAEEENRQRIEAEARKVIEPARQQQAEAASQEQARQEEESARRWIGFEALLNKHEAHKLAVFLKMNGIQYRKPQQGGRDE